MKRLYASDRPKELEKRKAWYKKNQERVKKQNNEHYSLNKEEIKFKRIFLKYGLTKESWNALYKEQNGVCAICQKPNTSKSLAVDHNHTTLAVRGLLCDKCNTALGLLGEDVECAQRLIAYILKHQK